jgi:hypothetical protein
MGSCCGSNSINHPVVQKNLIDKYKFPKIIVTSQDAALIYLDISPTNASTRFKNSLKRKFPNLISCDGEQRIIKQIERMKERKHYIIVPKNIRQETLRSMLRNPKVKSIYFCLEQMDFSHYSKSSKIKGFFKNQMDLKKAIFHDIRFDEST